MRQWNNGVIPNAMEQSHSWEANRSSATEEIPRILWNPNVHRRIHKRLPPVPTSASWNITLWRMRHLHVTILYRHLSASVRLMSSQVNSKQNTTLICNWCPIYDVRSLRYRTLRSWLQSIREWLEERSVVLLCKIQSREAKRCGRYQAQKSRSFFY
jgi:hypothetical protein